MSRHLWIAALAFALVAVACNGDNDDQRPVDAFIPFDTFVEQVRTAAFDDFDGATDSRVRDDDAFNEMLDHVLTLYDGADVDHSFELDGQVVDCITIESQPSVRLLGIEVVDLAPPAGTTGAQPVDGDAPGDAQPALSPLTLGRIDALGNAIRCEPGTVPVGRLTLDVLVRFETLRHFFSKGGDGFGSLPAPQPERQGDEPGAGERRYAYTNQTVNNYGGNSWLNLWNPSLGADGTMSISQQWYSADGDDGVQTLEGGWQVLPSKYNTNNAVLFIYWTADGYKNTGCYNLDCAGFVQINNNWFLGGQWSAYSSTGGTQWGFELQWKLYQDNWWLFLKGPGAYEAVGYYPDSIYDGGPMADAATSVLYGGETATDGRWPEMGSGQFANQGWQQAAFQNTIFYIPRNENNGVGVWADLIAQEPAPDCYTVVLVPASNGGSWGTYFYFGGPGGSPC